MKRQKFLMADENYTGLDEYFSTVDVRRIMIVHGRSMTRLPIAAYFARLSARMSITHFTDFTPNPDYASSERGAEIFNGEHCDAIVAVGGGSAIDTAKCIKLAVDAKVPLIAIPTTGGSGSESTQFAVVYRGDNKTSIEDESILPDAVLFDAGTLINLPDYQKKSTVLDAFCHAVESMWSVNANDESRHYAREALRLLVAAKDRYINGAPDLQCCTFVLYAANLAGRAINISKTTAAHAMSYRLTKKFGLAHGHAVARCLVELWQFMLEYSVEHDRADMLSIFDDIASATGYRTARDSVDAFRDLLDNWALNAPIDVERSIDELASSVNLQRLANNPIKLGDDDLRRLYRLIGG